MSPSQNHETSSRSGTVQISSADYDEIASQHPRARLTYLDDDDTDGDKITVGSSLELSQRLDEPPVTTPFVFSGPSHKPMHIFDIRRSNSVTELWKRYDTTTGGRTANDGQMLDTVVNPESQNAVKTASVSATSAPGDDSEPLLSAFEAELASIMSSANTSEARAPQPEPEPTTESSTNGDEQRTSHPAELLAAQIMHHLVNGVNMLQSELSTKLPELQRQVRNAQRSLPEHVSTSLQGLLATLEAQMRAAYNNLPSGGRQMAEDAMHAGRPVAENAADSLRMMASEFNEVGRTLFTAFENEFGRMGSQETRNASNAYTMDPRSPPRTETTSQHATSHDNGQGQGPPGPVPMQHPVSQMPPYTRPSPPVYSDGIIPRLQRSWACRMTPPQPPGHPANIHHRAHPPPPHPSMYWSCPLPWNLPPARPQPFLAPGAQDRDAAPRPSPGAADEGTNLHFEDSERKTLFIGNVGFKVTETMIRDVFASKGFVVDVVLPLDEPSSKHAGFGYLHFPSIHPALAAMDVLQGAHIDGHAINLEFCDVAPAESLRSSRVTSPPSEITGQTHTAEHKTSSSDSVLSEETPSPRASRRKSVTFQEPIIPPKEAVSVGSKGASVGEQFASTRPESPPLIDLMADDTASTAQQAATSGPGTLLDFNPELEMSRFPPVSRLEAQRLSKQRSIHPAGTSNATSGVKPHPSTKASSLRSAKDRLRPSRSLSNVRDSQGPAHTPHDLQLLHHDEDSAHDHTLRRSNTVAFAYPRARHAGHSQSAMRGEPQGGRLRRRASERVPLRSNLRSATETDTWARLDRRERNRLSSVSHETLPGSFNVEEVSQPERVEIDTEEFQDANIQACISSLIDMGYGTVHDGGRSRMAVYAAASDGSLLEAIEMIEEERKAYARQGQQ